MSHFNSLSAEEQQIILDGIKRDAWVELIPDHDDRIFSYMTKTKQWQPKTL